MDVSKNNYKNSLDVRLHLRRDDMTSGTNQARGVVAMLLVMCTGLSNFHIAGGDGLPVLCFKFGGVSIPRGNTLGKLRVIIWNVESMTGKSRELARILRKRKVFNA